MNYQICITETFFNSDCPPPEHIKYRGVILFCESFPNNYRKQVSEIIAENLKYWGESITVNYAKQFETVTTDAPGEGVKTVDVKIADPGTIENINFDTHLTKDEVRVIIDNVIKTAV